MKQTRKNRAAAILLYVTLIVLSSLQMQSEEMVQDVCILTPDFFQKPNQMGSWSVGFEMIQMPRSVTGEELLHLPMINAEYRIDVTDNVNVKLSFNSCYLINLSGVNVNYSKRLENFKFEAGLTGKLWFGQADLDMIKAKGNGAFVSPSLSAAYFFDEFALIVKLETDFFVNQNYKLADASYSKNSTHYSGSSSSITYQQPLFANVKLNLSAKVSITELNYHQWVIYSSTDKRYVLPSFGVGLSF